jgi:hypothetical protein
MLTRNSSWIRAKKTPLLSKYAVKDPVITTQEILKWHMKYAAKDPLIVSRELVKSQVRSARFQHCITRTCKTAREV